MDKTLKQQTSILAMDLPLEFHSIRIQYCQSVTPAKTEKKMSQMLKKENDSPTR